MMGREKGGLNFAGRSSHSERIYIYIYFNKSAPSRTDVLCSCKDVDWTTKVIQGRLLVEYVALGVDPGTSP